MQQTLPLYKTLRKQPDSYYEVEVVQGQNTYSTDRLVSVKTYPALFESSGPQIGVCHSTVCELSLIESSKNWPRMAQFTVRVRLSSADNTQKSEWLLMGTFYTDERSEDAFGNLSITAYDRMLMTEQYWTDKIREQDLPASWPVTSKAWADMMVNAGLVEIDSRTTLDDTVPIIGLNTASTIRDNLRTIAAAHGSNWQMTPDGKLRLIPFVNIVDGQAAIAGIAIAGISVVGDGVIESAEGLDYAFLGMNVQSFDSSPALDRITGVNLETEAGNAAAAGTTAGYVLTAPCEFASSSGVADLCLSKLRDYVYKPFSAGTAILDPAAEVGDLVIINGRSYQMMSIGWNLSTWPTADIGAAYDQEVDHEYTILAPEAKTYRKAMAATDDKLKLYPTTLQMQSAISQSEEAIELSVSQTYVTINDYDTTIQDLRDQIAGTITQFSGDPIPTLNNYPAEDWTTEAERKQHVGALYLVTAGEERGQYYRFEQSGSTFGWVLVEDSALATALVRAAEAQAAAEQAISDAETAQQAADAAQGTADQARLDAVARAAEAQAAAITQAAIDATNKANQALQDAKDYATGEVERFVFGEYADDMDAIHSQIDQKVESYYQSEDPSTNWETPEEHVGDLWYNTNDQKYYRWSGTEWSELTANPPRAVFDVLDGKAQVFIAQPVPPYYEGDLWAQGETGDILRCVYEKHEGQLFDSADWELASKYTDNSSLLAFINGEYAEMVNSLKQQLDQKAETYYQADDPSKTGDKNRWQAIAGIAVAGITIIGGSNETHKGDMWYRTTDDTTWYWNGTNWVQQNIPKEMFDFIDGKAQIFVNQPIVPYQVGDLWFNSETSDIMTCIRDRSEGSFTASDWQKRNKYTDDTKANAVEADLNEYKTTTNATLDVHSNRIDAKVETTYGRDGQTATKSFSWELTDSAHRWFANNNKKVMEITASGLSVEGQITATSGYIGDGSNGFTISASSIHNGMTSFNDTTHDGVYIGTDGISLGGGKFKVDAYGNLTAATGTFSGSVYASNIKSTAVDGFGGSFSGLGITPGSIGAAGSTALSGGVTESLGFANDYNAATASGATGPGYFSAGVITAHNSFYSSGYYVSSLSEQGEYNLAGHYHRIIENADGTVTVGSPYNSSTPPSFKIADTKAYKDGVSAVTVTSISAQRTTTDSNIVWNATNKTLGADYTISAKNKDGSVVYTEREFPITLPAAKAYNAGKTDYEPTSITAGRTTSDSNIVWNATNKTLGADFTISAKNANGSVVYSETEYPITIPATKAYNAAKTDYEPTSITAGRTTSDSNIVWNSTAKTLSADFTLSAKNATGSVVKSETEYPISLPATKAYDAGANTVAVTDVAHRITNNHQEETIQQGGINVTNHYVVATLTGYARTTKADGTAITASGSFTERRILANKVYEDGKAAGGASKTVKYVDITEGVSGAQYHHNPGGRPWYSFHADVTYSDGTISQDHRSTDYEYLYIYADDAYDDGHNDGVAAKKLKYTDITEGVSGAVYHHTAGNRPWYEFHIDATYADGSTSTYHRSTNWDYVYIYADDAYNDGIAAALSTYYVTVNADGHPRSGIYGSKELDVNVYLYNALGQRVGGPFSATVGYYET